MCGIIGAVSINSEIYEYLINGLKQMQNRGYDSAGLCTVQMDHKGKYSMTINKYATTNDETAIKKLERNKNEHFGSYVGLGHTRWATHGAKTDTNSHPHASSDGKFVVCHNGIVENYSELKAMLIEKGYTFSSQTDTEIISNLLSYNYRRTTDVGECIKYTIEQMEGTWGLVIICIDYPDTIYCTRHGSPIVIGMTEEFALISSEQCGFDGNIKSYFTLDNHDICSVTALNKKLIIQTSRKYEFKNALNSQRMVLPNDFEHWTKKEIYEQPESANRAISAGGRLFEKTVRLGGLNTNINTLKAMNHLIILGCGTSFFAGQLGMHYFKEMTDFDTVQLFDGAEFAINDIPKSGKTCMILLSQSGETKDLHRCLGLVKDQNIFTIGVINGVDSLIAREVNCGCYLNAGREVAVASTKSFTSQVIVLSMMAVWFASIKNIHELKRGQMISDLHHLSRDIERSIWGAEQCLTEDILMPFDFFSSCFVLGKGKGEAIARETALKIKEISYIHAEGYSTSCLKHGPFALLKEDFPVILIAPDNGHISKNMNAYEEIKSRHANIVFVTDDMDCEINNAIIVARNDTFSDLLCVIPMQLLAYKLSIRRNINPDMPKNLAKVVTVE